MPRVVNPHILQSGCLAKPPPRFLQVRPTRALTGARDDVRVPLDPDRLGPTPGIGKVNPVAPYVVSLRGLDF